MATTTHPRAFGIPHFETIYAEADGNAALIPWGEGCPSPALVNWLNAVAPSSVRCGSRVAVVGCGLGADARELIGRGYDVTAFDCSPTAVAWARSLDPRNADCYYEADLFQPPARWHRRFDLVVEINTLQALAPDMHLGAMSAIADLMAPRGRLLTICRGAEHAVAFEVGPPWALTEVALVEAAALAGLQPEGPIAAFQDDQDPPVLRMRAVFRR